MRFGIFGTAVHVEISENMAPLVAINGTGGGAYSSNQNTLWTQKAGSVPLVYTHSLALIRSVLRVSSYVVVILYEFSWRAQVMTKIN